MLENLLKYRKIERQVMRRRGVTNHGGKVGEL
jgi:hypothetical protein